MREKYRERERDIFQHPRTRHFYKYLILEWVEEQGKNTKSEREKKIEIDKDEKERAREIRRERERGISIS